MEFQAKVFNTNPQAQSFGVLRQAVDALLAQGASIADVLAGMDMVRAHWAAKVADTQYNPKLVQPAPPGMNGPRLADN